jgi:hypothetical protein
MASCRAPWWRILLHKWTPFLFSRCPGRNYHWFWDRRCICIRGENGADYAMKTREGDWIIVTPPFEVAGATPKEGAPREAGKEHK